MKRATIFWFLVASTFSLAAPPDFIEGLSKKQEIANKLGIKKLTKDERAEWNDLLVSVY